VISVTSSKLSSYSGEERASSFLLQRLSVWLQRFNSCFTVRHFRDRRRSGPIVNPLDFNFFPFDPWELVYTQGYKNNILWGRPAGTSSSSGRSAATVYGRGRITPASVYAVLPIHVISYHVARSVYVSIQPSPARDFRPLESRHFVSILRYLIQFLSLCSFVMVGLGQGQSWF